MKKLTPLAAVLLLALFALSGCTNSDSASAAEDSAPNFLNDIGKPLSELKAEHPTAGFTVRLDGFPDSAAVCLEEPEAEYAYFFFGGQSGDFENAMNECENTLQCAGFVTTAGVLFPAMEEEMSFEDFFALLGVVDYEYLVGEDVITGEGWLRFAYNGMQVMINTNEAAEGGGWTFTGAEVVRRDAPASIIDTEISAANSTLAEPFLFG